MDPASPMTIAARRICARIGLGMVGYGLVVGITEREHSGCIVMAGVAVTVRA